MCDLFSCIGDCVLLHVLLIILCFHGLFLYVGDASAASSLSEEEVDKRVRMYVDMQDPDVIMDLRSLHSGQGTKYDVFWNECEKFLQDWP